MGEVRFMISEAAKQVKVESHVLRYWEEELCLEIGRTEMGHRYYTKDDIQLFRCIKKLKDEGMLLKDLKPIIPELKSTRLKVQGTTPQNPAEYRDCKNSEAIGKAENMEGIESLNALKPTEPLKMKNTYTETEQAALPTEPSGDKENTGELSIKQAEVITVTQLEQVRSLIGDVLSEVVTSNNEELKKDISKSVTKDVIREMDFLFQAKERQEEEHFRKLDCLIRQQQANRRETAKETPIGRLRKLLN